MDKKTLKSICFVLFCVSLLLLMFGKYGIGDNMNYFFNLSGGELEGGFMHYSAAILIAFYILIGLYSFYKNDIRMLGFNGFYGICLTFLWREYSTMSLNALIIVMVAETVLSLMCGKSESGDNQIDE